MLFQCRRFEALVLHARTGDIFGIVVRVGCRICWQWECSGSRAGSFDRQHCSTIYTNYDLYSHYYYCFCLLLNWLIFPWDCCRIGCEGLPKKNRRNFWCKIILTGRMSFPSSNQQHWSTEGMKVLIHGLHVSIWIYFSGAREQTVQIRFPSPSLWVIKKLCAEIKKLI